jgi:hypothetical protein
VRGQRQRKRKDDPPHSPAEGCAPDHRFDECIHIRSLSGAIVAAFGPGESVAARARNDCTAINFLRGASSASCVEDFK